MFKRAMLAAALALVAGPSLAQTPPAPGNHWNTGGTVTVSCWRGPWRQVIWDHAQPVFIDSLVAVGYDYPSALSIATRVCRDESLVGDLDGLKAEMERIIAEAPQP